MVYIGPRRHLIFKEAKDNAKNKLAQLNAPDRQPVKVEEDSEESVSIDTPKDIRAISKTGSRKCSNGNDKSANNSINVAKIYDDFK